ncbi:MAG: M23 family metallopeptidase [Myxococcota bacterium]
MVTPQTRRRSAACAMHLLGVSLILCSAGGVAALEPSLPVSNTGDMGVIADLHETVAARSALEAAPASRSQAVAEYAPVSISSLPLHRSGPPKPDSWGSSRSLTVVTKGVLDRGESLSISMRRQGIASATIHLIASEISRIFDFRHARPGDRYRLAQDPDGMVLDFRYSVNPEKSYYMFWEGDHYEVQEERAQLRSQLAKLAGSVDSSLYEAIARLGEKAQLASDFADIFAWDIDFSRNVRPGDDFQILFERLYRTNEEGQKVYVKPGRILAARYLGRVAEHAAVFFSADGARGGYYRPEGSAMERAFLMAPLAFSRISSAFSSARPHPILKVVRPHRGIDYAAPPGTSIWSVGDGKVIYRGWAGASGNLVKVKHHNGYVSSYAHLSGFAASLEVGDAVTQKQVIGFVGQTGLATGPHVCFRVQQQGRYVNPLDIASPVGDPIARADWSAFSSRRDILLSHLGIATLVAAEEAL